MSDRAQSTVEFALVLPLVFLLLLGLLQSGVFLRDQLLVSAAAREGAREAAVTADRSRIEAAARRAAPGLDLAVSVERGAERGDAVRVEIAAPPTALPLVGAMLAGRRVSAEATMRVERAG